MKTEQLIQLKPRHIGDYRFGWLFSFLLAIGFAPFIVEFQKSVPWLIAVPIGIGAIVIFIAEWKASVASPHESGIFESIPEGYQGIKSYEKLLTLEIHPPRKANKNQLALFEAFPETTPTNSIRVLYDKTNHEIATINCDRYSALLITYLLDNLDKATEKSLRAGLTRFGELGKGHSDIQMFVHDKTIREAIKADFRGNLVTLVSKGGEKVAKDLLKAVEAMEEAQRKEKLEKEKEQRPFQLH